MTHETKFTPGPWKWAEWYNGLYSGKQAVLDYQPYQGMYLIYPNQEANAHLIAAAPDLYETLERILMAHDYDGAMTMGNAVLSPQIHAMVKHTLAKARGEAC